VVFTACEGNAFLPFVGTNLVTVVVPTIRKYLSPNFASLQVMNTRSLLGSCLLFILLFGLVLGCGSSKTNPAQVSGKVLYNGQPVLGGMVVFHSSAGVYTASINSDGTYTTSDLPEGEMVVTVDTEGLNPDRKKVLYDPSTAKAGAADKSRYGGSSGNGVKQPAPAVKPVASGGKQTSTSPVPEGANADSGTYVKIPKDYADKAKSPLKVVLKSGRQEQNLELKD